MDFIGTSFRSSVPKGGRLVHRDGAGDAGRVRTGARRAPRRLLPRRRGARDGGAEPAGGPVFAGLHQAEIAGDDGGVEPVLGTEFAAERGDIHLDRRQGQLQVGADFLVALALGDFLPRFSDEGQGQLDRAPMPASMARMQLTDTLDLCTHTHIHRRTAPSASPPRRPYS